MTAFPIVDGHNDTLLSIHLSEREDAGSFFTERDRGHIDLPRARRGGFAGGFFAIFVPPLDTGEFDPSRRRPSTRPAVSAIDPEHAGAVTDDMIALLNDIERRSDGAVRIVRNVTEMSDCLDNKTMAAILHFEGAEAIHPDLGALAAYYERGLRSVGLVWSRPNDYGHGVPFRFPGTPDIGPGLTPRGVQLVRACNELGVLVDLSHLNERGFWDVARHSVAPLVVTHAAAHSLSPSSRNLTDRQIDAVGATHGVIGVNFHVGFLRADGATDPDTPLDTIVEHADYMVGRIGIEHVALGSDFDGATMPQHLGDVAGLPRLIERFRDAGYDDDALRSLTHGNWLRVLRDTWR